MEESKRPCSITTTKSPPASAGLSTTGKAVTEASQFARRMLEKGVYVVGFCYPVVPKGRDRIRTQISAGHTKEDLDFAVRCFGEVKKEMGL